MKSVKVMLAHEVRVYSANDGVKVNDIAVVEGPTGFITASIIEVGPPVEGAYPIAAYFDFFDYGNKVRAVQAFQSEKTQLQQRLIARVNSLSDKEISEKFPELFQNEDPSPARPMGPAQ